MLSCKNCTWCIGSSNKGRAGWDAISQWFSYCRHRERWQARTATCWNAHGHLINWRAHPSRVNQYPHLSDVILLTVVWCISARLCHGLPLETRKRMLSSGAESKMTETWWSFACQFRYNTDLDGEYNTTSLIYPASRLPLLFLRRSPKSVQKQCLKQEWKVTETKWNGTENLSSEAVRSPFLH
jgi:hypothetical protein